MRYGLLALLALSAAACSPAAAHAPPTPAPTASAADRTLYGSGTLEAARTAPMSFDRPGTLREVAVTVGDVVEAGALLARLDDRDTALGVQRERASLDAERAALARLRADEAVADARLRIARREAGRTQHLFDQGSTSGSERDRGDDSQQLAALERDALRAQHPNLSARISQASSRLSLAEWTHRRDTIRAPFRARVLRADLAPGAFVSPGQPVVVLAPVGEEVAAVWVHEQDLPSVRPGASVSLTLRDVARTHLDGTVLRVRPEADGRTHEARVDVSLRTLPPTVVFGVRLDANIARSTAP